MRKKMFKGIVTVFTTVLTAGMLTACGGKNTLGPINNRDSERDNSAEYNQTSEFEQGSKAESKSVVKSYDIYRTLPFYNGHAWVSYLDDDKLVKMALIDDDGNTIYTGDDICGYYYADAVIPYFQNGVTYVNLESDTSYRKGVWEYDLFENGLHATLQSEEFVIIDENGNELYRSPKGESGTYSVHQYKDRFLIGEHVTSPTEDKYIYYVIDKKGNRIFGDSVFELNHSDTRHLNQLCGVFENKYYAIYDVSENYGFFYNIEDNSMILLGDDFLFSLTNDNLFASNEYVLIGHDTNVFHIIDTALLVEEDDLENQDTFDSAKAERLRDDLNEYAIDNLDRLSTHGIYLFGYQVGELFAKNLEDQILFMLPSFENQFYYKTLKPYNGDHAVLYLMDIDTHEEYKTVIDEEGNIGYDPIALDEIICDYNGYIFTKEGIISPTGEKLSYGDKLDGIDNNTRVYIHRTNVNNINTFLSGGFYEMVYIDELTYYYMSLDGSKIIDKICINK